MKNLWMFLAGTMITLSLIVIGIAPVKSVAAAKMVTGEVVSVDPSMSTLVIKVMGPEPGVNQEMTFNVLKKNNKILADLNPGDRIWVQFTESEGKFTAESIKKS